MATSLRADNPPAPEIWQQSSLGGFRWIKWLGDRWIGNAGDIIVSSSDAIHWVSAPDLTDSTGIERLGAKWIAVGAAYTGVSQNEGANWSLRSTPPLLYGTTKLACNGATVVGCGSNGLVSTIDGYTWITVPGVTDSTHHGIIWTGSAFVCVGDRILRSVDGVTWTDQGWSGGTLLSVTADASGHLLAVGNNGLVARSDSDGASGWVAVGSGITDNLDTVVGQPGKYLARSSTGPIYFSSDGATWQAEDSEFGIPAWNGFQFIVTDGGGRLSLSTDGQHWEEHDVGSSSYFTGLAASPSAQVAVGQNAILTSNASQGWHPVDPGGGDLHWNAVQWCGSQFVAVCDEGVIGTSPDGSNWALTQLPNARNLNQIAWNGQRVTIFSPGFSYRVVVSTTTGPAGWEEHDDVFDINAQLANLTALDTRFLAMVNQQLSLSSDGIHWTTVPTAPPISPQAVAGGGGKIFVVAYNSCALSVDGGQTWTSQPLPQSQDFLVYSGGPVIWDGQRFVVQSFSGPLWTTTDGTSWTQIISAGSGPSLLTATPEGYTGYFPSLGWLCQSGETIPRATVSFPFTVVEGSPATLTATLSRAVSTDVAIHYATRAGTAVAGTDYQDTAGVIVVPAGQTTASVTISTIDNSIMNAAKNFSVDFTQIDGGDGVYLMGNPVSVSIQDNDPVVLSVDDLTVSEDVGVAMVHIHSQGLRSIPLKISVGTTDGSATETTYSVGDFLAVPTDFTLPAGTDDVWYPVQIVDDNRLEGTEQFTVFVSRTGSASKKSGTVTILDGGAGYDGWVLSQGYDIHQSVGADTDRDGYSNIVSYGMGLPIDKPVKIAGAAYLPRAVLTAERLELHMLLPSPLPQGVECDIEESTDAVTWTATATGKASGWVSKGTAPVQVGPAGSDARADIGVGFTRTRAQAPAAFMRVRWVPLTP